MNRARATSRCRRAAGDAFTLSCMAAAAAAHIVAGSLHAAAGAVRLGVALELINRVRHTYDSIMCGEEVDDQEDEEL